MVEDLERIEVIQPQPTAENPLTVENYPYGYTLRTKAQYWVETIEGKGQRVVFRTLNPKTQRWNKEKKSIYSDVVVLYRNLENGHVENDGLSFAYADEGELQNFLTRFPESTLTEFQRKQLVRLRAIIKTRKHIKVNIVTNPTPERAKEIEEKNKKTDAEIHAIYNHYLAEERRNAEA